jgi:hypothetical protein
VPCNRSGGHCSVAWRQRDARTERQLVVRREVLELALSHTHTGLTKDHLREARRQPLVSQLVVRREVLELSSLRWAGGRHVPYGGPSGGNGGDGGNIIVRCAGASLSSLKHFRTSVHFRAKRGDHGGGAKKEGSCGQDTIVEVPVGTVVRACSPVDPRSFAFCLAPVAGHPSRGVLAS